MAEDILDEEISEMCHVYHAPIEDAVNRYDYCLPACHEGYMSHVTDDGEICLTCPATQAQLHLSDRAALHIEKLSVKS